MAWICERCNGENTDYDKVCIHCKESETPFYRKKGKASGEDIITLRLNKDERAQLEDIKLILDISSDGAAFKLAAFKGWDVLQRILGRDYLKWLCDKERLTRGLKK